MQVEPFRIAVPDAVLTDLRQRLARTRFPDEIADSGWTYGTDLAYLRGLVAHWYEGYDWRAAEAALNVFPQFKARVGDLAIHLMHVRGVGPRPFPLVITHGWPGSVAEFAKIIAPLTDPARHGGDPADAFDVVAPSMPGYGFSDCARGGHDAERIAALWAELMRGPATPASARRAATGRDGRTYPAPSTPTWSRDPSQHGGGVPSRSRQPLTADAGRGHRHDADAGLPARRDWLPAHPGHEAADARLRAERPAGGLCA
jgi:pimeloyl-ACP methyl ester carboxylesterase